MGTNLFGDNLIEAAIHLVRQCIGTLSSNAIVVQDTSLGGYRGQGLGGDGKADADGDGMGEGGLRSMFGDASLVAAVVKVQSRLTGYE